MYAQTLKWFFPHKSIELIDALVLALDVSFASEPNANQDLSVLFHQNKYGMESEFVEEVRAQHLFEVENFGLQLRSKIVEFAKQNSSIMDQQQRDLQNFNAGRPTSEKEQELYPSDEIKTKTEFLKSEMDQYSKFDVSETNETMIMPGGMKNFGNLRIKICDIQSVWMELDPKADTWAINEHIAHGLNCAPEQVDGDIIVEPYSFWINVMSAGYVAPGPMAKGGNYDMSALSKVEAQIKGSPTWTIMQQKEADEKQMQLNQGSDSYALPSTPGGAFTGALGMDAASLQFLFKTQKQFSVNGTYSSEPMSLTSILKDKANQATISKGAIIKHQQVVLKAKVKFGLGKDDDALTYPIARDKTYTTGYREHLGPVDIFDHYMHHEHKSDAENELANQTRAVAPPTDIENTNKEANETKKQVVEDKKGTDKNDDKKKKKKKKGGKEKESGDADTDDAGNGGSDEVSSTISHENGRTSVFTEEESKQKIIPIDFQEADVLRIYSDEPVYSLEQRRIKRSEFRQKLFEELYDAKLAEKEKKLGITGHIVSTDVTPENRGIRLLRSRPKNASKFADEKI
jgi:hypothetical protein